MERRLVRLLHPRSAFDDATRAFRAVRYANRLGFAIERETRRWILAAVESGAADSLSGDRLRRELFLLFSEGRPAAAVREMVALRISRTIHPVLQYDAAVARRLRATERLVASRGDGGTTWLLHLLAWMGEVRPAEAGEIAERDGLPLGTVKGRLRLGLKRLSSLLAEPAPGVTGPAELNRGT